MLRAPLVLSMLAAVVPGVAVAHVDVRSAGAGSASVVVSVPNESGSSDTVSVAVRLPENVVRVEQPDVPRWREERATVPVRPPIRVAGVVTDERVQTVTWSGGALGPGDRVDFPLRIWLARGTPRTGLEFRAVQRYGDGTVVRWIGPAGSQHPAAILRTALPTLAVTAAPRVQATRPPAQVATSVPTTAAAADHDSASIGIAVIVAAVVALGTAGAVLLARRMRRRQPR
jgi:uncharacterized protein YcnI